MNDLSWTKFVRLAIIYIHDVNRPGSRLSVQRGFPPRNFVRDRHRAFVAMWSRKLNELPSEEQEKVRGKRFGIFCARKLSPLRRCSLVKNPNYHCARATHITTRFLVLHKCIMHTI